MSPFEPLRVVGPLTIESVESDGRGKGRLGSRIVLVSQAYPGDSVTVRVDTETRGTFGGRVRRVATPSEHRVKSPCQHEFWCTGCAWIGASESFEATAKLDRIKGLAHEIGVATSAICPLERPSAPLGYRHYAKSEFGTRQGALVLGSYVSGTHWVVDNEGCPVLVPALAETLSGVLKAAKAVGADRDRPEARGLRHVLARRARTTGETLLVIASGRDGANDARQVVEHVVAADSTVVSAWVISQPQPSNSLLAGDLQHVAGATTLSDSLLGTLVEIGPRSFFQANPECAEAMFSAALKFLGRGTCAWDLYAGVGVLSVALGRQFDQVFAVEAEPEAAALIETNARKAGVHVRSVAARVENHSSWIASAGSPEAIVADPPRKGLGSAGVAICAESSATRLVLLSCDVVAWQRDARELCGRGFRVASVLPFDAFPKTAHLEIVTLFER